MTKVRWRKRCIGQGFQLQKINVSNTSVSIISARKDFAFNPDFDIAQESGVSTATVDRVLNNRSGVNERTRNIRPGDGKQLGYFGSMNPAAIRSGSISSCPRAPIPSSVNLKAGARTAMAAQERHRVPTSIRSKALIPSLAAKLEEIGTDISGCRHPVALDHPAVREAMRRLAERGVKIVTLVSDILHAARSGYIGVDNRAAGRLAGYLIGRLLPRNTSRRSRFLPGRSPIAAMKSAKWVSGSYIAEEFPHLEIVQLREIRDDRQRAYEETASCWRTILTRRHLQYRWRQYWHRHGAQ